MTAPLTMGTPRPHPVEGVLHFLQRLGISLWLGGMVFLAFVLAPVAFTHLPEPELAGSLVRASLISLYYLGDVCGLLMLIGIVGRWEVQKRPVVAMAILGAMLGANAFSQLWILPHMDADRAAVGGDILQADPALPQRAEFDRLHHASEDLMGAQLLGGVALLALE